MGLTAEGHAMRVQRRKAVEDLRSMGSYTLGNPPSAAVAASRSSFGRQPPALAQPAAPGAEHALIELVRRFRRLRVLVLGDVVADEQIVGGAPAVAREAPILVLQERDRYILPGGATNVAYNARALGAEVCVCGVVGADATAGALRERLVQAGLDASGLVVDPARPTSIKTRIWAGGAQQQVQQLALRIDRVDRTPVAGAVSAAMLAYLRAELPRVDALIISDYENGVVHPAVIELALPLARALGKLVAVDAHGDLLRFRGAAVFTPNQPEAEAALGQTMRTKEEIGRGGCDLWERLGALAVLITRGAEGMSLIARNPLAALVAPKPPSQGARQQGQDKGQKEESRTEPEEPPTAFCRLATAREEAPALVHHLPAVSPAQVIDPTGAGDTVAAVFTLAAAAGASALEAARVANYAAAVVVGKMGAATVSADELEAALRAALGATS